MTDNEDVTHQQERQLGQVANVREKLMHEQHLHDLSLGLPFISLHKNRTTGSQAPIHSVLVSIQVKVIPSAQSLFFSNISCVFI